VLGFVLPENFRRPFASANLQDHWRRWHITLSTWLRDYLYIPLGGSRNGPVSTYWNLFLTMALGGLWHGAAWTYVLWGSMQGLGLAVVRFMQRRWPRKGKMPPWRFALGVFVTFHFTCFGWIFFRSPTVDDSWRMLGLLMEGSTYAPNLRWQVMLPIVLSMGIHWTPRRWVDRWSPVFASSPAVVQAFVLAVIAVMLAQLSSGDAPPFIYFQF
jgi:alginate O-acetyltransferase complex protein AlgI